MANLIPFKSWADVLAYARTGQPLYYRAPMDRRATKLVPSEGDPSPYTYEVRARTIKIWPPGSVGRGRSRTSDPFSTDTGHLERFSRPEQRMNERRRVAAPGERRVAARDPEITEIGHIGDMNWPEHGGGPIFRRGSDDNDCFLEYVEPREDFEERWTVYRVELEPGVPSWGDLKAVAKTSDQSPKELRAAFDSPDPMQRAWAYETWAGHYGWGEFDQDPLRLTCAEMNERYPDADIDCGEDEDDRLDEPRRMAAPSDHRVAEMQWVPPELSREGIQPRMLEILLYGMGEHASGRVPRAGDSLVYDRDGYIPLEQNGYIVRKAKTQGLSSLGDYYVLTDKGADIARRYRLAVRNISGRAREPRRMATPSGGTVTARTVLDGLGRYLEHDGKDAPRESARIARLIKGAGRSERKAEAAMEEIDKILGAHGVEALRDENQNDRYFGDVIATYVNMGDTYDTTVVYDVHEATFHVTSWGDWFEEYERRQEAERKEDEDEDEHLDETVHESNAPSKRDIDVMFDQYVETALWSSTDGDGKPLDSLDADVADSTQDKMRQDVESFARHNAKLIAGNWSQAGHDFWLTRNRHGAGFWEKSDWPEREGKLLTDAAHAYGEVYLYVGDDGMICSN